MKTTINYNHETKIAHTRANKRLKGEGEQIMNFLRWKDLSVDEQAQAKDSYLSILEDIAADGDDEDKAHFRQLLTDNSLLIDELRTKSFLCDPDGYIFVNL